MPRLHDRQGRLTATPRRDSLLGVASGQHSVLGSRGVSWLKTGQSFPLSITTFGDLRAKSQRTKGPKCQGSWLATQWAETLWAERALSSLNEQAGVPAGMTQHLRCPLSTCITKYRALSFPWLIWSLDTRACFLKERFVGGKKEF